jgi:hypothetical protein
MSKYFNKRNNFCIDEKNKKKYFEEIKEIENKYYEIIKKFDSKFIKPINLDSEREKFFYYLENGKKYNPQLVFNYKKFDVTIPIKLEKLYKNINLENDYYGLKKLYYERIKSKINEFYTHFYWGSQESTKYVIKYRGKPDILTLLEAKHYCKNFKRQKVKFRRLKIEKVKKELHNYVKELTGTEITIVEDPNLVNKINIDPKDRKITINPNERFTTLDMERLKVHEIGTHFLRYWNGHNLEIKILESGTSNYIQTEEGLAAYMEKLAGVQSKHQMYIYAGRVIATYYALKFGFYDVYKILKKYGFKDSDAFTITLRAKRNLSDTSVPGGFTKDYVYFKGYKKIKRYHEKGGDLKKLFIGKIKLDDLIILSKYIEENYEKIKFPYEY